MTVDITAERQSYQKSVRITTAGADPHSVMLMIREFDEARDEWKETEILLSKAEALLTAQSIVHYFDYAVNESQR